MSLRNWPDELLQLIVEHLESERDLNCFTQTSRRHYSLLNDYLYRGHIQRTECSALLWAAYHGREGTARTLLRLGANPNIQAIQLARFAGQTPLAIAVQNGHENMVRLLIATKADLSIKDDRYRMTPLAWAAAKGYLKIFQLLLEMNGVDADAHNVVRRIPLSHAAEIGHLPIVKLLLAKNVDPNSKDNKLGRTALLWATTPKAIERECKPAMPLPWVPARASEPEQPLEDGLDWTWKQGWLRAIQEPPPRNDLEWADYEGGDSHSWAVGSAYEEILELLLTNGADIDFQDFQMRNPLLWAAKCGSLATLASLLMKGAHFDGRDYQTPTPLSWAAQRGQEAMVVLLLERKVEVNLADSTGRTPLSWPAEGGHEAIVQLLLNAGAEPGPPDSVGQTPLSWAAGRGYLNIVRLLHKKGVLLDADVVPHCGLIPLSWAAQNGHDKVVEFFLQNGVCPESGDGLRMRPPVHHAAKNGHLGIVKQLLEKSVGHGYQNTPEGKKFSESAA